jgi:predicted ribosome quality control (RQC) complex YloA/Tae2 family protein
MEVEIDLRKSLTENANHYFELSKKAKKKLVGLEESIKLIEKKIFELKREKTAFEGIKKIELKRKKNWFEKFHWFFTSNNFLVIAGRDAQSNEQVIKKYLKKNDLFFHADIQGAPHTVLLSNGRKPQKIDLEEAAQFAGIFSKAWSAGIAFVNVYSAFPEQVSKKAPHGESLGKGAFMVYGKRTWFKKIPLKCAIGIKENNELIVFSGPVSAVKKHCNVFVELVQGSDSKGLIAKKLKNFFEKKFEKPINLDEIISMLPSGGLKIAGKKIS